MSWRWDWYRRQTQRFTGFYRGSTKKNLKFGSPEESITPTKKAKLRAVASHYQQTHDNLPSSWRNNAPWAQIGDEILDDILQKDFVSFVGVAIAILRINRFDVVAIELDSGDRILRIELIENAVEGA